MGRVFATATTGIAAYNIGGMTLHHFAGIDPRAHTSRQELLKQIARKKDAVARWKLARVLVIDEISMLDGRLFEDLEAVARQIRRNSSFFGGIQLILSGDFFQLPPVGRRARGQAGEAAPPPPLLCFESSAWVRGVTETVVLKEIFRQRDDEFVRILNAFRVGRPTAAMINKLNERYKPSAGSDSDDAIHIFSHNDDVLRVSLIDALLLLARWILTICFTVSTDQYSGPRRAGREEVQLRLSGSVRAIHRANRCFIAWISPTNTHPGWNVYT